MKKLYCINEWSVVEFDDQDFGGYIHTTVMKHIHFGTMVDRPLLSVITPCKFVYNSVRHSLRNNTHSHPVKPIKPVTII